jgi:hypothetical protein
MPMDALHCNTQPAVLQERIRVEYSGGHDHSTILSERSQRSTMDHDSTPRVRGQTRRLPEAYPKCEILNGICSLVPSG